MLRSSLERGTVLVHSVNFAQAHGRFVAHPLCAIDSLVVNLFLFMRHVVFEISSRRIFFLALKLRRAGELYCSSAAADYKTAAPLT